MVLRMSEIIRRKRDGCELSEEEIAFFVKELISGGVSQSQIGALLMAIYLKDLSDKEAAALTRGLMHSGRVLEWPREWRGRVVDKHSTGGVGDKVSLILAPALAAAGLLVPMISGRGLGFTGGTLDKLESIPGFKVEADADSMEKYLTEVGCCIVGQSASLVPADKELYRIRDVTATVDNDGLVTASIVSKKAAESLDALLLDVKVGGGAMKTDMKDAETLARKMVKACKSLGFNACAFLTDMNMPLGHAVGNALEVEESVEILRGSGHPHLMDLVCTFGGKLIDMVEKGTSLQEGRNRIMQTLMDGSALSAFERMIRMQGVDKDTARELCHGDARAVLSLAPNVKRVTCKESGYISAIKALPIATVSHYSLGAGRNRPEDDIDYGVGIKITKLIGEYVTKGDVWCEIYYRNTLLETHVQDVENALVLSAEKPAELRLILDSIS